jgi:hypothetical protein
MVSDASGSCGGEQRDSERGGDGAGSSVPCRSAGRWAPATSVAGTFTQRVTIK